MADLYTGQATTTETTVFTSTNGPTIITAATVCNDTATAQSFSLWVTRGGTQARLYKDETVSSNQGFGLDRLVAQYLDNGDTIQIQASNNTSLDFVISGER